MPTERHVAAGRARLDVARRRAHAASAALGGVLVAARPAAQLVNMLVTNDNFGWAVVGRVLQRAESSGGASASRST